MNKLLKITILLLLLNSYAIAQSKLAQSKLKINKISNFTVENVRNELPIGSGLAYFKANAYGITRFYTVIDNIEVKNKKVSELPFIAVLKLKREKLKIERYININNINTLDINIKNLDIEAISTAPNDELWLVDEVSLKLLKISTNTGSILKIINPRNNHSKILNNITKERGFEGLTFMPNNKLLAVIQSPINNHVLFYYYDLINEENAKFLSYKVLDKKNHEYKIGGLQAVSSDKFLVLERLSSIKNSKEKVKIKLLSLKNLSAFELIEEEKVYQLENIATLKLNKKELDLQKIEGITILEGSKSIALINDGDGIEKVKLVILELSESLLKWSFKEYLLSFTLGLILIASLMFTFKVLK